MDKLREEFEEWFSPREKAMKSQGLGLISISRLKSKQWEAWQASRSSIVIEFIEPPFYAVKKDSTPIDNIRFGAELAIEQVRRSIGLSIKGE